MDLSLFEFDMDLTMMVFFLNADQQIYGRYGGRDARNPNQRQSLVGLEYSMKAALERHRRGEESSQRKPKDPLYLRQLAPARGQRCIHCHQAKEIIHARLGKDGQWSRDLVWRYPLPENLGFTLDVDGGNVVKRVKTDSPAAALGFKPGDVVDALGGHAVRSFADAQFALDQAPPSGHLDVVWQRGVNRFEGRILLPDGWRRTDIRWRRSVKHLVASARLFGKDLSSDERSAWGLSPTGLAFWQKGSVPRQAREAGILPGDIILGFDDEQLEMDAYEFQDYVSKTYLVGDRVDVNVIRNGQQMTLQMTLQ